MTYPNITAKLLTEKNACEKHLKLFKRVFKGKSVKMTEANAVKYAQKFNWSWAADNLLLTSKDWNKFNKIQALALTDYVQKGGLTCSSPKIYKEYNETLAKAFVSIYAKGMKKN